MESTTRLPDAVQWSEGMLLSPQHLQQNDIYWHEHLRHRLDCITPHYWGVGQLTLDHAALIKGVVSITRLECVLPDGLAVDFDGSRHHYPFTSLDTQVDALCKPDGKPVRIWLVVRERGAAAAKMDNPERRYDSLHGEPLADENTGDGEIMVQRLRVRLKLHAEDAGKPAPAGRSACPLLEVARDAQGHLRLTGYHPPLLRLEASAFQGEQGLQRRLTDFTHGLWAKMDELAGGRDDDKPEDESVLSTENRRHLAVARHLAMGLPPLEIAVAAPHARPHELYRALAQVAGQVASIGTNPIPLKMKPYRHEDCMPQFQAAFDYIEAKLALVNTAYECLSFARIGDAGFARLLPSDMGGEVIVELKPRDGQSLADLTRWLADACIACDSLMTQLQQQRLPGALTRPLSAQEIQERNLRPQAALFLIRNQKIEVREKGLQDVLQPGHSLLIRGAANANAPAAIILYRKKPSAPKPGAAPVAEHAEPSAPIAEPIYA